MERKNAGVTESGRRCRVANPVVEACAGSNPAARNFQAPMMITKAARLASDSVMSNVASEALTLSTSHHPNKLTGVQ